MKNSLDAKSVSTEPKVLIAIIVLVMSAIVSVYVIAGIAVALITFVITVTALVGLVIVIGFFLMIAAVMDVLINGNDPSNNR